MTYQTTINDFRDAIAHMESNTAFVVCSEKPKMQASITFNTREDGAIYTTMEYIVGNEKKAYDDNLPIKMLMADFNKAMHDYDSKNK